MSDLLEDRFQSTIYRKSLMRYKNEVKNKAKIEKTNFNEHIGDIYD